jgi:hypothetical protein
MIGTNRNCSSRGLKALLLVELIPSAVTKYNRGAGTPTPPLFSAPALRCAKDKQEQLCVKRLRKNVARFGRAAGASGDAGYQYQPGLMDGEGGKRREKFCLSEDSG